MKQVAILTIILGFASASALSPVTRVVELLKDLSKEIEKEGKEEQDLYDAYMCWGTKVIEEKTAVNAAAKSKIDERETYMADLNAGRITLTDEKSTLTKDIDTLHTELEEANALREKEHEEYVAAAEEMKQGVDALAEAKAVLGKATAKSKEGVFMAIHSELSQGAEVVAEQQSKLAKAAELGEQFLGKADATFLRRLLTGDVTGLVKPDWKKLNRKGTFKMKYKARSFKIQDILNKMHHTFEANLAEANEKEDAAVKSYEQLTTAKKEQLDAAQDALTKSAGENNAVAMSRTEKTELADSLKKQVEDNEAFIEETTKNLETKSKEWNVRVGLREDELAAISKAIGILHSDDSRDLFKKSLSSQDKFFFLQTAQSASRTASMILRETARKSGDASLLSLARLAESVPSIKERFATVVDSIDEITKALKEHEAEDIKIKEECEDNRMKDTQAASVAARTIDDTTDEMTRLQTDIEKTRKEIQDRKDEKAATEADLKAATKQRAKEHAGWQTNDKLDEEAADTVASATEVLTSFYADTFAEGEFIQKSTKGKKHAQPEAPKTWEGGYGGKTSESQGIVALLDMVRRDMEKDRADAQEDEEKAEQSFQRLKKTSESEIEMLAEEISKLEGTEGDKGAEKSAAGKARSGKKKELDAVLKKIADVHPDCEYFTVNFNMRQKNRQTEMDGLANAKAILQGGKFEVKPDPDREIRPGDAFLQRRK